MPRPLLHTLYTVELNERRKAPTPSVQLKAEPAHSRTAAYRPTMPPALQHSAPLVPR